MTTSGREGSQETVVLDNGRVRATIRIGSDGVSESYYVVSGGEDRLIATNVPHEGLGATFLAAETDDGDRVHVAADYSQLLKRLNKGELDSSAVPRVPKPGPAAPVCNIKYTDHTLQVDDEQILTLLGETTGKTRVERRISVKPGDDFLRVEIFLHATGALSLEYFNDRYSFSPTGPPDFTWTPQLKRIEQNLCADWSFKSPAAIMQKNDLAFALIPDVNELKAGDTLNKCNVALDMDVRSEPGPMLSYGLVPSVHRGHSLFRHVPGQRCIIQPGTVRYSYYVLLGSEVPARQAHRRVVGFLWDRFGRGAFLEGHAAQEATFTAWEDKTWHEYADKVWEEADLDGTPCGFLRNACEVFEQRWGMKKDAWFCGWWNNLRTSYGMELYSRRSGDDEVHERAGKMLNLALDAPRKDGAFPVLFLVDEDGTQHWERDHPFGGYVECYHTFDMSWTGYWLLRWHNDLKPKDKRILPKCVAYGDFLVKHQSGSGFIPSYFNEDLTLRDGTRLNEESAEPAACALFLVELYRTVGEKKYLDAAIKAMEYVQREIVPENKWFDYETFLSCSRKPYDTYDSITAQHPQNNMGTIMATKAFLALYDVTHEERFIQRGLNVLDYLSLTQQVWSHPAMTPNLIGGFTTQNSDAEWSDARQAYCAVAYLDYFERCGKLEYLERGIAALRASFPVAPYENWAHVGFIDLPGALSGIHWGQGSGMASVEMVWDKYGDVLVDLAGNWAYGINGCTVEKLVVEDKTIGLEIKTDLLWDKPARIVFRNVADGDYELNVNGACGGRFSAATLAEGASWRFTSR